jgi:hypothetical protein
MVGGSHAARFESALAGAIVRPPARGLSFVDPKLLPGPTGSGRCPDTALARAAGDLRLDFAFVPSWEPWAARAVEALRGAGVAPLWVVPGVVWPALEVLGVEEGLHASVRAPGLLTQAMDGALALARRSAQDGLGQGACGLVVADDMAGARGPLLDAAFLARHAFPRLAGLAAMAAAAGVPALLHCDGDARSLFEETRAAGFAAVHGDHGGGDGIGDALRAARRARIALVGGLPTASMTDPAAGALAGTIAATLAEGGGLLVSDDGGITTASQVAALFGALGAAARAHHRT